MKYAIVNEGREEAQPGLSGACIGCGHEMVAKCGEIKVWHWAHRGKKPCDPWKENETDWHRAWNGNFAKENQECIHYADDGEKHIADVKTDLGWVLEFQHSHIHPDERRARTAFYKKLVWVVNGLRRKKDKEQFFDSIREIASLNSSPLIRRICSVGSREGALLRDWSGLTSPVFFDFGDETTVWCLLPNTTDGQAFTIEFARATFLGFHQTKETHTDQFGEFIKNLSAGAMDCLKSFEMRAATARNHQLYGFQNYQSRNFSRRRL